MPAIELVELATLAAMESLAPEWTRLWRDAEGTPFQSPAWTLTWWRHFGRGSPLVLVARQEGRLVGVAPLFAWRDDASRDDASRDDRRRRLLLMGTGNTDHLDALVAPGLERAVAMRFVAHLARPDDRWDECDLQQLRPGSPLLTAPAPPRAYSEVWEQEPCPVLPLTGGAESVTGRLRPSLRSRLAYARRRAARTGQVHLETADERTLPEILEALFALHGARWGARGEGGVLADVAVRAFHRDAAPALLALGALRLHALRLEGRIIAVHYGMADRWRQYYYLGGFDPAHAKLSPGSLVLAHAIEVAARAGARELDFLRGREAYKYEWGALDRPTYRRVLGPRRRPP